MKLRIITAVVLFLCLLSSIGCNYFNPQAKQRKLALTASEKFLADWNAHNWISILQNAEPELLAVKDPEDQRTLLGNARGKMGAIVSTKEISGRSMDLPDGAHYFLEYDTVFEAGKGKISLHWKTEGDQVKLAGWNVDSPLFVRE